MTRVPEQITATETMSHALFTPGDTTRNPYWVKQSALIPPNKSPNEVSFNRACYLPDNAQKRMAQEVKRQGKRFTGFVVLNQSNLTKAIELLEIKNRNAETTGFEVSFKYTPIYIPDDVMAWPDEIEKKWGNGYNPAHADLYFEQPVLRGEHNPKHLGLAAIICNYANRLCNVFEDEIDSIEWKGDELCTSF